jgi:hypothetical protein
MGGHVDELTIELYKTLKAENAAYQDKLQSLWLQKFTLCGALAAFFITSGSKLDILQHVSPGLLGVGLIVVLAVAIDCKVLEYGLHVRAISRFIARTYHDAPAVTAWEALLWGQQSQPERTLVQGRSFLTVVSAAMPTLAIVGVATRMFIVEGFAQVIYLTGAFTACYISVIGWSAWAMFRTKPT